MSKARSKTRRTLTTVPPTANPNDHDLIAISQWIPGSEPTNYGIDLTEGPAYETRFWRCRKCGQERNRRDEFAEPCPVDRLPNPVMEGGYSIDDPRTRRALSEDMIVHFGERGPIYDVESESGATYRVDVDAETCACPDHESREVFCKHLRRVDMGIRAGVLPGPDGTFVR
jgi:hypothetical protein